jgi:hypothetical protein
MGQGPIGPNGQAGRTDRRFEQTDRTNGGFGWTDGRFMDSMDSIEVLQI